MIPVVASRAPPAAASQFSRSCVRLLVLSAVPRPRHPALASRRASPEMTTTPTDNWLPQESIALVDNAPLFSAGDGDHAVTFWQIMVDSTPELSARSALECEEHWSRRIELRIEEWTRANERVGPAPLVLEDWTRLDDGRYAGRLSGQPSAVWLTVAKEGKIGIVVVSNSRFAAEPQWAAIRCRRHLSNTPRGKVGGAMDADHLFITLP